MKVFVCTEFEGYWPVGTAAVIVSDSEGNAKAHLREALQERGLGNDPEFLIEEIDLSVSKAYILHDGNY